ncbi:MAG: hypothetical protein KDC65_18125, partial [Saprospiraceae bacterium]|nr:hypothetical protein [Saprospiraceae bacterium]
MADLKHVLDLNSFYFYLKIGTACRSCRCFARTLRLVPHIIIDESGMKTRRLLDELYKMLNRRP